MATDLVKNNIPSFLDLFLSRPASSIPKSAQWAVSFDNLGSVLPAIQLAYEYEPGGKNAWDTLDAASTILTDQYQTSRGCLFCQAIGLPGEGLNTTPEGIQSNAFIRSRVGAGRNDFPEMRMTFLDTHVSFADSFLRGWSLATANFGLIMRSDIPYRTTMTCYKFGITPKGPFVTMKMTFKDICCISVSEEEYQYTPASAPILREARFVYNSYSVDTVSMNSKEFLANGASINLYIASNETSENAIEKTLAKNPNTSLTGLGQETSTQNSGPFLDQYNRQEIPGYTSTDKLFEGFSQQALDLQNEIATTNNIQQAFAERSDFRQSQLSFDQAVVQPAVEAAKTSSATSQKPTDPFASLTSGLIPSQPKGFLQR